jgi:hypothetical protein
MKFFRKVDGTGNHHIKWNKLILQRLVLNIFSYMGNESKRVTTRDVEGAKEKKCYKVIEG